MFATRYFAARYFAPRYWPKVGADGAPAATGGVVWIWVNGVSTPPGAYQQGTQPTWMCVNGVWYLPDDLTAPWPRRSREE